MRVHSIEKIQKLKELRKNGFSIIEIMKELSIPKTTTWHHIQGIKLSPEQVKILRSKGGMTSTMRRKRELEKAEKEAKKLLEGPYKYYYAVIAILHWTEGNSKNFSFVNTNQEMIKVYINLIRKCFNISRNGITVTVRYFTGMNRQKCLEYWSKVTKLSENNIRMYYNDGGKRGKSPYGMCRITVRKGGYNFKVLQELIKKVAAEINAPVAQLEEQLTPNEQVTGSSPVGGIE